MIKEPVLIQSTRIVFHWDCGIPHHQHGFKSVAQECLVNQGKKRRSHQRTGFKDSSLKRDKVVYEMYLLGKTRKEIAFELGYSYGQISKCITNEHKRREGCDE